jgi:hypothetical protein
MKYKDNRWLFVATEFWYFHRTDKFCFQSDFFFFFTLRSTLTTKVELNLYPPFDKNMFGHWILYKLDSRNPPSHPLLGCTACILQFCQQPCNLSCRDTIILECFTTFTAWYKVCATGFLSVNNRNSNIVSKIGIHVTEVISKYLQSSPRTGIL